MNRSTLISTAAICAAIIGGSAILSHAGPLDPPPGPVQSTGRIQLNIQWVTLPYTITEPGSYVLTSNLTGVSSQPGIVIASDNVTLDLSGFALLGVSGSLDGVTTDGVARLNIHIRDGIVDEWGGDGIDLLMASNSRVEDVQVANNGGDGINLKQGSVRGCTAWANTGDGIQTGDHSVVNTCTSNVNTGAGILTALGCVVTECAVGDNADRGINSTADGTVLAYCAAWHNGGTGLRALQGSTVFASSAGHNDDNGIAISGSGVVLGSASDSSAHAGILVSNVSSVFACSSNNSDGDGIEASFTCAVVGCAVRPDDGTDGIQVDDESVVSQCAVSAGFVGLDADSIVTSGNCAVTLNAIHVGGPGAAVSSDDSLILGNSIAGPVTCLNPCTTEHNHQ